MRKHGLYVNLKVRLLELQSFAKVEFHLGEGTWAIERAILRVAYPSPDIEIATLTKKESTCDHKEGYVLWRPEAGRKSRIVKHEAAVYIYFDGRWEKVYSGTGGFAYFAPCITFLGNRSLFIGRHHNTNNTAKAEAMRLAIL